MNVARIIAGIILVAAVYCGLDPFRHSAIVDFPDFESLIVEMPAWTDVPNDKDTENLLQNSNTKILNEIQGPESVAFDPLGRGPYTGAADGRILFWNGNLWTDFAYTSSNRSKICDPKPTIFDYLKTEHICGRPLGLRFDKRTGDLYIADAYLGLLKVGPEGGLATPLATEAEGVPLRFTNDLDIDDDGNIYFTDSSTKYQRRNYLHLVFSADNSGRVLKYDPITKKATVLLRNLQFPNGVSLSKDKSFFVYAEGCKGRLMKYWLKGEKAGTTEVMAILPGFPDNVRTNENGEFWVALHTRRTMYSYISAIHTTLRTFLLKLPIPIKFHYLLSIGGRLHAVVVKYSADGKILKILEDTQGKVVRAVSEVEEKDGKLWLGSVLMSFIAVYHLD
ncbi:protein STRICTOSIDINE SYNTHASE-LIKE 3-like [Rutidosis leptorrhynchoides]|uniref:protein STRICTOSIDINE SYNTHASE-LIKE 3-like n=1 Tax=Rutidosis leptorrhynchoides TaxID=125765 RepID=UPI003A9A330E